jgi:tRNA-dihydrouridine synthase A
MMDWTDRHCRYFHRLLAPHALLYTEMVTADAILHGDAVRLLRFDRSEHPVALQLGGAEPDKLAAAARIGAEFGYDEINLNVGCPSDRVQAGRFGACLMAEPSLVAHSVRAMIEAVDVPVTVKTRIGIDDRDDYRFLAEFVEAVAGAGCETVVVHARKAHLQGLSPRENRTVPPLDYERVYRLKRDFPALTVIINGGITSLQAVRTHLERVDGVMIGRQAYQDPWTLALINRALFAPDAPLPEREAIVRAMAGYARRELARGARLNHITRHMLGLYNGLPGARRWRRYLSEEACRRGAGAEVLERSLDLLPVAA